MGGCAQHSPPQSPRSPSPDRSAAARTSPPVRRPSPSRCRRHPPPRRPSTHRPCRRRPPPAKPDGTGPAENPPPRIRESTRSSARRRGPCAATSRRSTPRDGEADVRTARSGRDRRARAAGGPGLLRRLGERVDRLPRPSRPAGLGRAPRSPLCGSRSTARRRRVVADIVTEFADRGQPSIEDDIVYLTSRWSPLAADKAERDPLPCGRDRRRTGYGPLSSATDDPRNPP